jgi:hypothetical protein
MTTEVSVITPVYGNESTLAALADRVGAALDGRRWRLRFVIDASPDASGDVARRLAAADDRIAVSELSVNLGQHRALTFGLAEDGDAAAWVCLDADLQDPPEAIPAMLDLLAAGDVGAVFAGRRGAYESRARSLTGRLHRALLAGVTGLPADAGAFVALGPEARHALLRLQPPSIVAGVGVAGVATRSLPVERAPRPTGSTAWTSTARLRQSWRTLAWVGRHLIHPRVGPASAGR